MVVREPKHTPHTTATELTAEALRLAFGRGWHARVQEPVALEDDSEPEPDVAVVRGAPREYLASIPRGRRSSSKSRNRASRSIVGGRAGFMRGQISRITGSSTWWVVSSRSTASRSARRRRATAGSTAAYGC